MDKHTLRRKTIQTLYDLEKEKNKIEEKLYMYLFSSTLWKEAGVIGTTVSKKPEWNTKPIIEKAWEQGKKVAVPKCTPKTKALTFYHIIAMEQLEKSNFDLLEPSPNKTKSVSKEAMDLLIVPGVAFDKKGYRIGFGGGYYDRYLIGFKQPTISLIHTSQLYQIIPKEKHDIPVNYLITEKGWLNPI